MATEAFIQNYGYLATLVGTFLEGETVLVMAGFMAHRGYLSLFWVIFTAFLGALAGSQFYFYLGRRHGATLLAKHPRWQARAQRAHDLLERYHTPLILGVRFIYGIRIVGYFAIGMSNISTAKFILMDAIGALIWAIGIGSAGFFLGRAIEVLLGDIQDLELQFLIGIVILSSAYGLFHYWRQWRRKAIR